MGNQAENWIFNQISVLPADSWVLEVGCGSCDLTRHITADFPLRVVGSDIYAWGMHRTAFQGIKTEARRSLFVVTDVVNLGFKDAIFQSVFSVISFHHASNPQTACLEMGRVLEKGGILLLVDWAYGAKTGVPERYFRPEEMETFLEQASFQSISVEVFGEQLFVRAEKF